MLKQIPIDSFFKYKHEPIYIISLAHSYKEFADIYNIEYEEWDEDGLGTLVGATFEIENEVYFIKASKDPDKPYCQIGVYVHANCESPKNAVKKFLTHLNIPNSMVLDIGETFFYYRWQVVRTTKEDGDIAVENCTNKKTALAYLGCLKNKYDDKLYLREVK